MLPSEVDQQLRWALSLSSQLFPEDKLLVIFRSRVLSYTKSGVSSSIFSPYITLSSASVSHLLRGNKEFCVTLLNKGTAFLVINQRLHIPEGDFRQSMKNYVPR